MILPTSVMRIRIMEGGRKKIGLWIPIFLVWPIVIATMVALAPLALLVYIVWPRSRGYVVAGPGILSLCWALRGLEVRVKDDDNHVLVSFR